MKDNSPWRTVINLKYGTKAEGSFSPASRASYGVGLWKDMSKVTDGSSSKSSFGNMEGEKQNCV